MVSISLAVALILSVGLAGCGGEEVPETTEYNLAVSSTEGGSVTTPGEGIFAYEEGTDVNLEAVAEQGYVFDEWTGDVGTIADVENPTITITVNGDYIITASFKELPEQPTKIVIGTARDTDEQLIVFEQIVGGPVIREFVEQVNLSGGVHLSAYDTATEECWVPLEIDMRNFSLATWDIGNVTAQICADIKDGTVHFLWGGPGTDAIVAQAPVANEAGVVLLALDGGYVPIANDPDRLAGWPYVFITVSYSDWYQIPVLQDTLEEELGRAPKAYVTCVGGLGATYGIEYRAETINQFGAANVIDAGFHDYDLWATGAADAIITAAAEALGEPADPNYDIFCAWTFPWNVQALTIALLGSDFNPPAMIFGPGANFGDYRNVYFGPMAEGIMGFTIAAYDTNPGIQAVYDLIAERMDDDEGDPLSGLPGVPGIFTLDYWGTPVYWAGLEMWLEAVEGVGYVDQEKLRDALAGLEDDPADTILGDCWFRMYGANGEGGGNLDYRCHTGEIGQWQSGVYETVGYEGITDDLPNYVVTADFMFPMTDKWNWLQD